eukprot:TRINITY_DN104370_c0_g1_i1.p1 TRINITY_DN104370_c0_g1~~TRINITY_DN104370_c0_g1_i1.p1  ORF type:complete len:107 (-),score=24.19 TRINITY_DN104370_c0_g1_i1:383-703(-)
MCCWVFAIPVVALYTALATSYYFLTGQDGDPQLAVEKMLDFSPVVTALVAALIGGFGISMTFTCLFFGGRKLWRQLNSVPAAGPRKPQAKARAAAEAPTGGSKKED